MEIVILNHWRNIYVKRFNGTVTHFHISLSHTFTSRGKPTVDLCWEANPIIERVHRPLPMIPCCGVGRNVNGQSNGRLKKRGNGHKNEKSPQMTAEEARQRNFLAPVSRLPPELVLLVFTHLRDICMITRFIRRDWMNVTGVFHSWREIALCASNLWTNIRIS